jgi:creatinine amidohydrolase
MAVKVYNYAEIKWPEAEILLRKHWLIIPTGSLEQHGPHLPLSVDTIIAKHFSQLIAEKIKGVLAPAIQYGARSLPNSGGGSSYPGTIYVLGTLLIQQYMEILNSFIKSGATKILFLNGHWENEAFLLEAVERCRENGCLSSCSVFVLSWWNVLERKEMIKILGKFDGWHIEHAGQVETALMLCFAPELVDMTLAVDHNVLIPFGIYKHPTPADWTGTKGVLSSSQQATVQMGEEIIGIVKERILGLLLDYT